MNRCRYTDCLRQPLPGQAFCESHALRWMPRVSVERSSFVPEWRKRLTPKDFTGSPA